MRFLRLSILLFFAITRPAWSHEFWIEPEQYQVESDETIKAHLRNGENFKGVSLGWFDRRFTRFEIVHGEDVRPVEGRMGDTPALQVEAGQPGLAVILHETTPSKITYRDWEKFMKFVRHKDFKDAEEVHDAKGWSKEKFSESYTRHAKALVAVDGGAGEDRAFGLETEFVALSNPYSPDFDGAMRVLLFYEGAPRPDAQVEVFEKAPDGVATITLHRTDAAGEARVPVKPGHSYLFDAVVLRPSAITGTEENAPLWDTLWAALTFEVPDSR